MREREGFDRREFTLAAVLAALSGVTITVSACGGGGGSSSPSAPSNPSPPLGAGDKAGSISANHGHTAVITAAQLTAAVAVSVQLTVGDGHTHSVTLTAAEVTQIAGGTRVSKESSVDIAHSHTVTFN
jgi:hypothetical protein